MYGMAFEHAAAEQRMMAIGQNASSRVLREIPLQPGFLRRASRAAPQGLRITIRIQHHNVPVAQVVAIVALARWSRLCSPILEIARRGAICVLMISQSRFRPVLKASPRRVVAILEVLRASLFVGQIASGKNCARNLLNQLGRRFGALQILATGNVARADEYKSPLRRVLFCGPDLAALGMIGWRSRSCLRDGMFRNDEGHQDQSPEA